MMGSPPEHRAPTHGFDGHFPEAKVVKTKRISLPTSSMVVTPSPPVGFGDSCVHEGPARMQPLSGREGRLPSVPKSIQKFNFRGMATRGTGFKSRVFFYENVDGPSSVSYRYTE